MNRRQRKQRARERKAQEASPLKHHGDKFEQQIARGEAGSGGANMERAQKSEVHQTTDDAATSPASDPRTPKGRPDDVRQARRPRPAPEPDVEGEIGGGPGAGDASSGGGAGAGIPGGGTDMRMGEQIPEGDIDEDRARLFPDSQADRDESDFGGVVEIDTDEQGNLNDRRAAK